MFIWKTKDKESCFFFIIKENIYTKTKTLSVFQLYFGPVDIFVWNTEKSNLSPTHGTVLDIVQIKTKMYYYKWISITTMMNHDLLTKTVSQFDKNKQHVAPVHKNTNLKIPPSEHLFQPKTADP